MSIHLHRKTIGTVLILLATIALALGMTTQPVRAASPAHPSCAGYQMIPHGARFPASAKCVQTATKPAQGAGCANLLIIYADANFGGDFLCFGPGNYNLTSYSFCFLGVFNCFSANDNMSSFQNLSGNNGYFTWDINGGGSVYWFSAHQQVSYIGDLWNDQASYVHEN